MCKYNYYLLFNLNRVFIWDNSSLSTLIGFLTPGASGGIGIREGAFIALIAYTDINISNALEPNDNIFKKWNFSKKCQNIINEQIEKTIQDRNDASENKIKYQQLFNFHYNDGAKMLTIGGIISDNSFDDTISKCKFEELFFTSSTDDSFLIDTPNLTYREIKYLNKYISLDISKIPKDSSGTKIDSIIPQSDIKKFHEIYRYFPTFTEANL